MKNKLLLFFGLSFLLLATFSCEEDDETSGTKAVFSYVADGFVVNFTDFSQNASEYLWDFGDDSEPSVQSNPTHIYNRKGDYLVTLTVSNNGQTSTFQDSVYVLGPNIKIDGDFTDWEHVPYSHTNDEGTGGTLLAVKTFASAGALNFYLEGTQDFSMAVIDLYLDADNNPETGLKTWMYPAAAGADFLFEGNPSAGSVFAHVGPGNDWAWNEVATFGERMQFSAMKTVSGKKVVEFSIKREGLGTMKNFANFAIVEMNSGWTEVGDLPDSKQATSKFAQIEL
ncbi:PKD domain-containing protein [Rufibacter latericius]|uniref:PKD domain-containing protein n=1 Tax=Rufibacter latericius TaxID=2487040 RepID=A0A3M9MKH9_9BACT|nr:PKD domain-containing protein [Rufibacter latericius]RNI26044.1 PKD domain-containing protein [Rufibacter latericius]